MKLNITSILFVTLLSAVALTNSISEPDGRSLFFKRAGRSLKCRIKCARVSPFRRRFCFARCLKGNTTTTTAAPAPRKFDTSRSCFSQCRKRRPGTRFLALDRQCVAACKQQVAAQQQPQPQVQQFVAGRSCWSQCSKRRPGKRSRFLDRRCFGACKAQLGQ